MRNVFAAMMEELAAADDRLVLLSGDIGNRLFDTFKERFPGRFINGGVAEANLTGMAAGLALGGYRAITYTITPFATTRCLEQIRVDVCGHHLPVVIVGVGAGYGYAGLGVTHHSCEDIAFMRALPGMTILCPGDPWEVRACCRLAAQANGPVYLRLGKKGEPAVHAGEPDLHEGAVCLARPAGARVALLSAGTILPEAVAAAATLEAACWSWPQVKPLPEAVLEELFASYELVVTVEEHSRIGGLGGAVAEWLVDGGPRGGRLLRLGAPDAFLHAASSTSEARELTGLTATGITAAVTARLADGKGADA